VSVHEGLRSSSEFAILRFQLRDVGDWSSKENNQMKLSTRQFLLSVSVLVSVVGLVGCGDDGGLVVPGACSLDFSGEVSSNFGEPRIDVLLETTGKFSVAAEDLDVTVRAACNAIATDLGAQAAEDTETACGNAVTAIDGVYAANAEVALTIDYVPAVCSASAEAAIECTAECDGTFDATATPPTCEGGELSGGCTGQCTGECSVEASAACTGSCSASCTGQCDATVSATCTGICTGQCSGTCSATAADGSCAGDCAGTCSGTCAGDIEGSCSGSCTGSCSGSCRADVTGSCSGSCSGECDVAFTAPRCEGGELNIEADADCAASCESSASFDLECTEPELIISFTGSATVAQNLDALIATLDANLPTILAALGKAEIIVGVTVDLGAQLPGAVEAATSISLEAAHCMRLAIEAQADAAAKVRVSVSVSVEVSGSATAGGQ
jgi:hypothetical protein